jgi:pimeloyl-ACP methyl ester carboxylesterase
MNAKTTSSIEHRALRANGIRMHVAEQGRGPLVLLCHGFPESWYSYRHQLPALAAAGYRAVAPDMRGYADTERPEAVDRYTLLHLVGDMVGLLDALGEPTAVIVGHDWGAPVAWHCALLRPDRFRGVVGLSVPYRAPGQQRPTSTMPRTDDALFYQLYFQEPGLAEADLERDPRKALRRLLFAVSGDAPRGAGGFAGMVSRQQGLIASLAEPPPSPEWLTEADLDTYVEQFERTGFAGGLSWYRNLDRNWELLAAFKDKTIDVPALYIAGDRDPVVYMPGVDRAIDELSRRAPQLRQTLLLPGCGHWTQQERPREVNAALLGFLGSL